MITMTRTATGNFRKADGSINLERAIMAGHEARTDAIRGFMKGARQMIRMHIRVASERLLAQRHPNLPPHLTAGTSRK
jgi:hypothetical protein